MRNVHKTTYRVAAALAAVGLVLMAGGFALSGFDVRVFSASVDRGEVTLGGREVEHPERVPLLGWMAVLGTVEVNPPVAPDAPDTPSAP